MEATLNIDINTDIEILKAGLFFSRGIGTHIDRKINFYEFIFVKNGVLKMREEDTDLTVCKDQSVILWPSRRHYGTEPYKKDLAFYWVHFNLRNPAKTHHPIRIPQISIPQRPNLMQETLNRMVIDLKDKESDSFSLCLMMKLLLWEASKQKHSSTSANNHKSSLAKRIHNFIFEHCNEQISAGTVANSLRYNPDYLNRVYKQIYHTSITEAILTEKVREACELLANSNLNINEVALHCGFNNDCYFRKVFKKRTGFNPLNYRKIHDQIQIDWRCR